MMKNTQDITNTVFLKNDGSRLVKLIVPEEKFYSLAIVSEMVR